MKGILKCCSLGLLISCLISVAIWGQATAQINGTAKDQSGAVLPGVEITATQTETGTVRTALTDETGSFILSSLALGPYRLEAALPGFRTFAQTGIVLGLNSNLSINVTLEVGQVSETVEVQANATMVETRNVGVGQVIENERILELPLNGRNVIDLITLTGAAVQTGTVTGRQSAGNVPILSVGGGMAFGTGYRLDGSNHLNWIVGTSMPMPFPDALQEFKVETSGLSAQSSQLASVGAVTRSGTNEFHGNLFEFVRNDLFNARNYFATKGSTLKRNQFGGTIGGPIVRNKLFFMGGYQRTTLRQDPADVKAFLPTAAMLAGDWTTFASPQCNAGRQITLRNGFVDNRINPASFSRAALNIVNRVLPKAPKPENECGEVTFGRRTTQNEGQFVFKVDYTHTQNHSLFGRALRSTVKQPNPFTFYSPDNLLNSTATGQDNTAESYAFGDTLLLGRNMVQSFRLGFNRTVPLTVGNVFFSACDVGINIYCGYNPQRMQLGITGGFSLGAPRSLADAYISTSYEINDDVSIVAGAHQLALGANLALGRYDVYSEFLTAGNLTFSGTSTGLGMGDFFLGRPTQLQQGSPTRHLVRQWISSAYAADAWKMSPRLTLNYGLRWEPFLPETLPNNRVYNFDYSRFQQGIKSTVYKNAPSGFYYPGDPGFPGKDGIFKQWLNFAPRVGLAWDPQGNGNTSVRASYALTYHYFPLEWRIDMGRAYPWGADVRIPSPPGGLENPWQGVAGGDPFPIVLDVNAPFGPYGTYQSNAYDIKHTSASSWNLTLQKQLATNWLFSTSYIGSQTSHMWSQRPLNPAIYFPGNSNASGQCFAQGYTFTTTANTACSSTGNTNQRRRFSLERPQDGQYIGLFGDFDDGGTQSYNALLINVQRRATKGFTINGNYTWSHCLGDYADTNGAGPDAAEVYTHPNDRAADRGNCASDRRHVFNMTAVAETPQFANRNLRLVATGWRLAGIYRISSGSPLNVTAGVDRALTGIDNQRVHQIVDDPYGEDGPLSNYLNSAAFALADVGTFGSMARNSLVGPKSWTFDLSLSRDFTFHETQRLQFRAEAYNVTNSFRPLNPVTALNNANFGQIRTAGDPRIMQFALKYVF